MPGRRVVSREDAGKRLNGVLESLEQAEVPAALADLAFNVFWNVSGMPSYLVPTEQAVEDVREVCAMIYDADCPIELERAIFTALIPVVSQREHVGGAIAGPDGKLLEH